jgi:hypothetical protein
MPYHEEEHNEEDSGDTLQPLCTCGQLTPSSPSKATTSSGSTKKNWLESSFVHLMAPAPTTKGHGRNGSDYVKNTKTKQHLERHKQHQRQSSSQAMVEQHQHLLQLLDAAHGCETELCVSCIDRVAAVLEADTQRLYSEVNAYQDAVKAAQQRAKPFIRNDNNSSTRKNNISTTLDWPATENGYQREIELLEREVSAKHEELVQLKSLYKEQLAIAKQLDQIDDQRQLEQNALQWQSHTFEDRRQLLTDTLTEVQLEVEKLSLLNIPGALFTLQVDPRGLRYPLINQLRLAFHPKGDVPHQEVRVAWSAATQLLLFCGTLLNYPGKDWKLVPLAETAKLIYRKEIFNLNPGNSRSLMAWNALLDQVVKHALTTRNNRNQNQSSLQNAQQSNQHNNSHTSNKNPTSSSLSAPPFVSSTTTIGGTELARMDPTDHFGWSQVIHRMASNLLWLSNQASDLAVTQVTSMAHCAA